MWRRKEERKKNNPKNNGPFVPQQRLRAAHALRSDQLQCSIRKPLKLPPLRNPIKACISYKCNTIQAKMFFVSRDSTWVMFCQKQNVFRYQVFISIKLSKLHSAHSVFIKAQSLLSPFSLPKPFLPLGPICLIPELSTLFG